MHKSIQVMSHSFWKSVLNMAYGAVHEHEILMKSLYEGSLGNKRRRWLHCFSLHCSFYGTTLPSLSLEQSGSSWENWSTKVTGQCLPTLSAVSALCHCTGKILCLQSQRMYSVQYLCYSCKELLLIDVLRLPGVLITSFMRCLISFSFFF